MSKWFLLFLFWPICSFSQNAKLKGDVNEDGFVNAADIVPLVNIILNKKTDTPSAEPNFPNITINHIYGDGTTYCAFTTLVKRGGIYYIAFREGKAHVADGDYGIIKILHSMDGVKWDVHQVLSLEKIDLRDPNLSVMPDGRLLLLCGARMLSDNGNYVTRTYCAEEKEDGFDIPKPINLPKEINWETCSWVWRISWYKGVGYGICYGNGNPVLLETEDGINYNIVSYLSIPGQPSECRVRFKDDGTAILLARRNDKGYMGTSKAPYKDWDWKELNTYIAGQDFLIDGNRLVVATRMIQNIGSWTAVWFGDESGIFNWCYTLPFGCTANIGDTAYAGILNENEEYWVSYYAIANGEKPSVLLAKIPKKILPF